MSADCARHLATISELEGELEKLHAAAEEREAAADASREDAATLSAELSQLKEVQGQLEAAVVEKSDLLAAATAESDVLRSKFDSAVAAHAQERSMTQVLETRALDAERQARSACLQVITLEDTAACRTAEL